MFQELLSKDLEYLLIFSLVLILPQVFLRFKIPSGITALVIGVLLAYIDPLLSKNELFRFLSQLGITSLFLFAGLEVDFKEIKNNKDYLSKYLLKYILFLSVITFVFFYFFHFSVQSSLLFSLGIFTPSAGFIINSLHSFNINENQEYWIKSKAISKEVISIVLLFIALQGSNLKMLLLSLAFFSFLLFILPRLFRWFFKFISPYAPNSEIAFLVILSLISGVISKELGAYYLVGAFTVGIVGSQFKDEIFKEGEHILFRSLSSFFSVFLPFYFFYAGLKLNIIHFNLNSLKIGIILLIIFTPIRIFLVRNSFKMFLKNIDFSTSSISFSLTPTLIFGLVIANILIEQSKIPTSYIFGLIVYTVLVSIIPAFFFMFKKKKSSNILNEAIIEKL